MTLSAWRIYKAKHSKIAWTGDGARLYGGRFNSKGVPVVYTASSIALASLEMLVHLQASEVLKNYIVRGVKFDRKLVKVFDPKMLPRNWRKSPPPAALHQIGDHWATSGDSAVLQIPSAIVPGEANFLLNPHHRDFSKIIIGSEQQHKFDPRLLKMI